MKFHVKFQGSFSFFEISYKHFGDILAQKPEGSGSVRTVFFFWAWNSKVGVKAISAPNSSFFHGQKSFFTPTFFHFFGIFHGHFLFSRPLLRFFSRVKNMVSRPKFQEFSRVFWLLTGRIFDFFHAHYFSFHGRNFRKFSREKIPFHGYFLGLFQNFFTGTFFFHAQNS